MIGCDCRRWNDVVIEAAVFVIRHDQERAVPELFVGANRIVDLGEQVLTAEDIVRRMIVARVRLKVGRFDQRKRGEILDLSGSVVKELVEGMVTSRVCGFELMNEQERERKIVEVDLPGDLLLIQAVEDG